ncbi:hypothetical protein AAVH_22762 [Aphelenchoides avenae]|nr:hypothetical protein AAVH_22762 [Aphelenchus avenae]
MHAVHLYNVVETIVNGLSILFNGFLLYLVKNHSSFGSPVYQTLLAIDASLDIVLSVCVLVVQPICLTGGGYKMYFSDGYLAGWSDELDRVLLWVYFFLMFVNVMWIGIQFVCRYVYLCVRDR